MDTGREYTDSHQRSIDNEQTRWLAVCDPKTTHNVLEDLAINASTGLLERVAEHPNTSESVLKQLAIHPHPEVRSAIVDNPKVPGDLIWQLCTDLHPDVRFRIAENPNTPPQMLKYLLNDDNPYVVERARKTLNRLDSSLSVTTKEGGFEKQELQQDCQTRLELKSKLKILVIEDNPADARLLQKLLAEYPFELQCVKRLSEGLEYLAENVVDIILLDLALPDTQGIDTFYRLHCQVPDIPIVVLTGLEDEAVGIEAVQSGAQDYLIKGQVLPGLLGRSIQYAVKRHQAEAKMKQLNETLERRIIQLATANEELDKLGKALALSCEQALQASNFKSQFVARISHEIRAPISAVLAITNLLLQENAEPDDEEKKRLIKLIDESARSQLTLLTEILDFSKIESGKVEIENIEFSPVALLEDIAELFAAETAHKDISLMTYIDSSLQPILEGDPKRLREVLINLTNNAIKFTAQGEVILRATKESEDEGYVTVRFSVTDTGVGLLEESCIHLFEPFIQAHISNQYGGAGLGLSICKRLVDLMGGQISVESKEGKGSTFWFSVRLRRSNALHFKIGKRLDLHVLNSYPPDIRVLVVNNNSSARDIIQRYVYAAGWRSNGTAANAEEALNMLYQAQSNNDPYNVAIIDLESSTPDSFELANIIQKDPILVATHLIFLTNVDQRQKGEQAWSAGFSAYLTKPIKQWSLLDCITEVVNGHSRQLTVNQLDSSISAPHSTASAMSNKRILVAEDSPVMRYALVTQLEKLGVNVDAVSNGLEAVGAVSQKNYALILMDCQMPVMTGLEATIAIRELQSPAHHTPIVAITCGVPGQDRISCIEAGMDDYLIKPVSTEQLRNVLENWALIDCNFIESLTLELEG